MRFYDYVQINKLLAPHTTLGVGGPADYFIETEREEEVCAILDYARQRELPVFVLGGGSNVVIADAGWRGLVIRVVSKEVSVNEENGKLCLIRAAAGAVWDDVVALAVSKNLQGLECLSGIPGLVGAAPIQNIGAYGQEAAETIAAVHVIDRKTSERRTFLSSECDFGYRTSRFKTDWADLYVVTRVDFRLQCVTEAPVRYADVARELSVAVGSMAPLAVLREAVLRVRRRKSMVLDHADPNSLSVGSFFTNPIVDEKRAAAVKEVGQQRRSREPMPCWQVGQGQIKLSAAWLIEAAGFSTGYVVGRTGLSTNHTLAIVNRGGASAAEVIVLAGQIRKQVQELFGVSLEPEPCFVGFEEKAEELLAKV